MTDVKVSVKQLLPQAGAGTDGLRLGRITSGAKAAQNDTWTVANCNAVIQVFAQVDATGAAEANTISGKTITLTSATTGACSALILYR